MEQLKETILNLIFIGLGEVFAIGGAVLSIGGFSGLSLMLINISVTDYLALGFKTFILGMIGALGGLVLKLIWSKIVKK